jgi:DNA-binding MarR family transcriptional regulator
MARIRTIKPQFFIDQDIAALHPLTRQLFLGLWCLSDRKGRLEDKPAQIKVQILPYDQHDIEIALKELSDARFIIRYQSGGKNYIEIRSFEKHQHCHIKEPDSTIPAPGKTGAKPGKSSAKTLLKEGKGREGKGTIAGPEITVPEWLSQELWTAFKEMRKSIKKPLTEHAEKLIIEKLSRFKEKGHDPNLSLKNSIEGSWQGVFEPKAESTNAGPQSNGKTDKEKIIELLNDPANKTWPVMSEVMQVKVRGLCAGLNIKWPELHRKIRDHEIDMKEIEKILTL